MYKPTYFWPKTMIFALQDYRIKFQISINSTNKNQKAHRIAKPFKKLNKDLKSNFKSYLVTE